MDAPNMEKTCKNYQKCPIYSGVLKDLSFTSSAYKELYCDAGTPGWSRCRRYQVKELVGKVPEKLLPNSLKSADEIIKLYNLSPAPPAP